MVIHDIVPLVRSGIVVGEIGIPKVLTGKGKGGIHNARGAGPLVGQSDGQTNKQNQTNKNLKSEIFKKQKTRNGLRRGGWGGGGGQTNRQNQTNKQTSQSKKK